MANYKICPHCKTKKAVKNGTTSPNKYGIRKQNYICRNCNKEFVEKRETLTRTEKRLFSLLCNLIQYEAKKDNTLKEIVTACNKEVPSIGKLDIELTNEDIDLNKVEDVKIVICQNENDIKIIKTYPEVVVVNIKDLIKKMNNFLAKYD